MKPFRNICALACIAFSIGRATADPLGQQLSFTADTGTTWNMDWDGVAGRTYFIQWSLDLETWSYAPMVEFGTNPATYGTDSQGVEK